MNGIVSKGTATPLNQVIARGAFGAVKLWRQRMNGADIADYPALINGEESTDLNSKRERLRIINGGASTSF
jgi:hypothetical protein